MAIKHGGPATREHVDLQAQPLPGDRADIGVRGVVVKEAVPDHKDVPIQVWFPDLDAPYSHRADQQHG